MLSSRNVLLAVALLVLGGCPSRSPAPPPHSQPHRAGPAPAPAPRAGAPASAPRARPPLVGDWYGALEVPGGRLRLALAVWQTAPGTVDATIVSIDQGGVAIPINKLTLQGDRLHLELTSVNAAFDGTVRGATAAEIAGTWSQGGMSFPITFRRGRAPEVRRPQEPKKPYPYREEEVTYENRAAGVRFAATLTLPKGRGPFPAVVFISGSGPEDRNETVFGHRPFLVLADYLTRRGIATLRADDRGVGGSTGKVAQATSADFAADALAGVAYLKKRTEIDRRRIGLVGHSEGGIVAPIAAVRSRDVAFIVLLAGTGLTGEEILGLQAARLAELAGAPKDVVARAQALQKPIYAALKEEKDPAALERRIRAALAASGKKLTEQQEKAAVQQLTSPWFRSFLTYDPRPTLRQVRCPVLALIGEKDAQVTAKENVPAIEGALKAGRNRDYTVRVLPGLNHLFQHCTTGAVSEYAQIEETFAPEALAIVGDWIVKHTRAR